MSTTVKGLLARPFIPNLVLAASSSVAVILVFDFGHDGRFRRRRAHVSSIVESRNVETLSPSARTALVTDMVQATVPAPVDGFRTCSGTLMTTHESRRAGSGRVVQPVIGGRREITVDKGQSPDTGCRCVAK